MTDNEIYLLTLAIVCFIIAVVMNEWRSRDRAELLNLRAGQRQHEKEMDDVWQRFYQQRDVQWTLEADLKELRRQLDAIRSAPVPASVIKGEYEPSGDTDATDKPKRKRKRSHKRTGGFKPSNGLDPFGVTGGTGIGPFGGLGGYGF